MSIKPEIFISYIPDGKIKLKPEVYVAVKPNGQSAIVKPEVFISYIPDGTIKLKPEVYVAVKPNGQTASVKPEVFISFLPSSPVEKVTADLSRRISSDFEEVGVKPEIFISYIPDGTIKLKPEVYVAVKPNGQSAIVKPEVFISYIPDGTIKLKPEVYVAVKPNGQTASVKPEVFISFLPSSPVEKVTADLFRRISSDEVIVTDSLRKVARNEKISADTYLNVQAQETIRADSLRLVNCYELSNADTKRTLYVEDKFSGDTTRRVVQSDKPAADTFRQVKKHEIAIADTSRKNGLIIISADTKRNIISTTKNAFDSCRVLGKSEKISADTYLRTVRTDIAQADSFRKVIVTTVATADTLRKISVIETFSGDTSRTLGNSETAQADTYRQVTANEIAIADLFRALREVTRADSLRKVNRTEKKSADTVIRVPHILNYVVKSRALKSKLLAAATPSLVNTFKDYGITAFNISLNEKTLSDDFTFETTRPMEINDAVQGTLLDYHFNFLVEETTQTDLVQIVRGRYNVDDLLYKWFTLTLDEEDFPPASWIAENIAHYFLLTPDVSIDDFTPTNFSTGAMMTYSDVLNSVFGWTSRLPQRQVNVFIRGGTLHCIQRGKEHSVFDITDLPHSRPTINKKFNRVLVHNPNNDTDTEDTEDTDNEYRFTGTISYRQDGTAPIQARVNITYTYENGLLVKEYQATTTGLFDDGGELKTISSYSSTNYSYTTLSDQNSDELVYYISDKSSTTRTVEQIWSRELETNVTTQSTSTSYNYESNEGAVYLFQEHEQTTQTENDVTEKSWTDTYHVPVGNGWYAQTVYRNGIFQGANLSQGAPSNAVSPYTIKQAQESFKGFDIKQTENPPYKDDDNGLSAIVDDSFPVKETEFKSELNSDLRWLHRKIEETVTVDLISPVKNGVPDINHIVDFTERIKFNGAEYFLVSNRISFTPRKFIQKLQLIRWY